MLFFISVKPQMKTLDFETLMEFEPLADISVATPLNNFDQEVQNLLQIIFTNNYFVYLFFFNFF